MIVHRGHVEFAHEEGDVAPKRGSLFAVVGTEELKRVGWFHRGSFVARLPQGVPLVLSAYGGDRPWQVEPSPLVLTDGSAAITLALSPSLTSTLTEEALAEVVQPETPRALGETDPSGSQMRVYRLAGTVHLPGVWRDARPALRIAARSQEEQPDVHMRFPSIVEIDLSGTDDPHVLRWSAGEFPAGEYTVSLDGILDPRPVTLGPGADASLALEAPPLRDVVVRLVDTDPEAKLPAAIEWSLDVPTAAGAPRAIAPWIDAVMRGRVAAAEDGAYRFQAPEGDILVSEPDNPIPGRARITVTSGGAEEALRYPFSIPVVALFWAGSRDNWRVTWDYALWPLCGRGEICGGTGSFYLMSEPGEYLVTAPENDDWVPIEPFVTTLKPGEVNEIWIEVRRRDGAPIRLREQR